MSKNPSDEYRLFGIAFFLLIVILITAASCTPHNYPDINKHDIRFEPGNEETYIFSDHRQDSLAWPDKVIPNGYQLAEGIRYEFWQADDTIYVKAYHRVDLVKWHFDGLTKGLKVNPDGDNIFKHKFSDSPHTDGYFTVELPW